MRSRKPAVPGKDRELLQTVLGLAYTVAKETRATHRVPSTEVLAAGLHPALHEVAALAKNLTEASGAAVALGNADAMVCMARSGASSPPVGAQLDSRSGLSGECIRTQECTICVNASADPRVNYQACRALDIASMLYLPLRSAQGKLIGVLGVFSSQPLHFSQRDIACLKFTEQLVQEALSKNLEDAYPATLEALLRQGDQQEEFAERIQEPVVPIPGPKVVVPAIRPVVAAPVVVPPRKEKPAKLPMITPATEKQRLVPTFVGRVVDEAVADEAGAAAPELPFENLAAYQQPVSRIPAILALVATLLVVGLAAWNYHRQSQASVPTVAKAAPQAEPPAATAPAPAQPNFEAPVEDQALTSAVSMRSAGGYAKITILLPHAIQAEGYGLSNPDRIYFDLHDVKLTDAKGNTFKRDDGLISRVRLAQSSPGVTRVVFDLREPATWEARQENDPQRLVIEIHRTGNVSKTGTAPTMPTKVTIVIDPGHGGRDLGTVSPSGLREKDLTLDVALRLGLLLQERLGANVVYTRDKDEFVSLDDRAEVANKTQADFLISIHGNSSSLPSVRGVETYYFKVPSDSESRATSAGLARDARTLAADVHSGLLSGLTDAATPMRDRGVRPASFVVLRQAQMPAVLAEISFISNKSDEPRLESAAYREQIAKALYSGIANHLARSAPKSSQVADLKVARWSGTP